MCRMVDRWCNYRVKSNGYRPSFRKIKQQQNNRRPVLPYFAKQGNRLIDGNSLEKKPGRGWAENRVGLIISLLSSKASMDVFSFTYAKLVRHDRLVVCYAIIYWTMPIISFFLLIEGGQHCERNNEERWQMVGCCTLGSSLSSDSEDWVEPGEERYDTGILELTTFPSSLASHWEKIPWFEWECHLEVICQTVSG